MRLDIGNIFEEIVGQPCTRKEVGSMGSISLGFGGKTLKSKGENRDYRLWEIGTYTGYWQIIDGGESVLLSKNQAVSIVELDALLQIIELGNFVTVQELSRTDIRIKLNNGLALDIYGNSSEDDEYFHVFCPEGRYVEFSGLGWKIGLSNEPWLDER